jgi:hypothetical protein
MKILANRVYLNLPKIKEYKVEFAEEIKKQLQEELLAKMDKLTVMAKGEGFGELKTLLDKINIGDQVFVEPSKAKNCPIIEIDGDKILCVPILDIMHVW